MQNEFCGLKIKAFLDDATETSITRKNSSYEPTKQICKLQTLFLEGEKKVDRIRGETTILQAIKTKFDHELHFLRR